MRCGDAAAEAGVVVWRYDGVGDLVGMQDGAPTRRSLHDVDAGLVAAVQIEKRRGVLHPADRDGRAAPRVKSQRDGRARLAAVQQRGITPHVFRAGRIGFEQHTEFASFHALNPITMSQSSGSNQRRSPTAVVLAVIASRTERSTEA